MYGVMKLPLPSQTPQSVEDEVDPSVAAAIHHLSPAPHSQEDEEMAPAVPSCRAPAYGKRASAGFVPRAPEDFGDGGAYPEIHVAQYPLGLGKKVRHWCRG